MNVTIAKRFSFDAAHHLPTVPAHHKCHRMHGHTYGVELRFAGPTAPSGFCAGIDYDDIKRVWERIHRVVDHQVLNEIPGLEIPSTEVLAVWIAETFIASCGPEHTKLRDHLASVRVSESSSTWCEYVVSQAWRRNVKRTPTPHRGDRG